MSDKPTISTRLELELAAGAVDLYGDSPTFAIPSPGDDLASLTRTVRALKAAMDMLLGTGSSVIDKALTTRDMLAAGTFSFSDSYGIATSGSDGVTVVVSGGGGGSYGYVDPRPVIGTPAATTGWEAFGGFRSVILRWDNEEYQNRAYTEIWRHTTDNLAAAIAIPGNLIGQPTANVFADSTAITGVTYYYWARDVTTSNVSGAFTSSVTAGVQLAGNNDIDRLSVDRLAVVAADIVSINADTITFGTMDGDRITVGTLNANRINAGTINTGVLFAGQLIGATGTFSGSLSAATGTFSGALSAATGTFAGALSAATGTFSGTLTASVVMAGVLSGVTGTLGTLTIAAGGYIRQGQTAYNTGSGFWLGDVGGVPKFSLGNSAGAHMRWDGTDLFIDTPTFEAFTSSIAGGDLTGSVSYSTQAYGSKTVTPSGGKAPYQYFWILNGFNMAISSGAQSATVSVSGYNDGASNTGTLGCIVKDSNGRATFSAVNVNVAHASSPP